MHAVATIGFEQPIYTFREGTDTSIEVCFKIQSPGVDQIDAVPLATVNVEPVDGSALGKRLHSCSVHTTSPAFMTHKY